MKRRWILVSIFIVVGVLIYAGLFLSRIEKDKKDKIESKRSPSNTNVVIKMEGPDTIYKIKPDKNRLLYGYDDSIVKIIAFVDFSNSSSIRAIRALREIASEKKDVAVYLYSFPVYKNGLSMPLSNLFIHLVNKGRMREFIDYICEKDDWGEEEIKNYLIKSEIKIENIFVDYGQGDLSKLPALNDMNLGVNFGVSVPPAFFVNGLRVDGFTDNSRLRAVVDAQIRKAQEMIERGTDRRMVYDEIVKNGKETAFIVKVEDRDNTNKNIGKGSGELPNIYEEDLRYVPIKGPRYAPVTIVVFLDYECPYSKRYYEVIRSVMERYEKDIRVFIKHFPLSTHQRSIEVARYLASALAQKKFWLLFDKIMSYPEFADEKAILRFASEVQIDVDRLKELKDSEYIRRFVENDMEKGYELQIKILPTTYINGIRYEGVLSTVKLSSIIEKELINANRLIESGVKMEELYDNLVRMNRVSNLTNLENKLKKPYMEKIK